MEDEYEYEGEEVAIAESDAFSNVGQGLQGRSKMQLVEYWQQAIDNIERIGDSQDGASVAQDCFKTTALPLARIKKVMKTDSDVKMISAEAPILFAKGCDIFITELTMRAWIHAEESKRRTLQRSDIATALQKSDMFDFLIDIVPREEAQTRRFQDQVPPADSDQAQVQVHHQPPSDAQLAPPQLHHHPHHHQQQQGQHAPPQSHGSIATPPVDSAATGATSHDSPQHSQSGGGSPDQDGDQSGSTFQPGTNGSPYELQQFDDVKLERQYDDFEYQTYEQVDV